MNVEPIANRSKFDWEDARQRLARLADTLDAARSMLPAETSLTLGKRADDLAQPLNLDVAVPDTIEALTFKLGSDTYALETAFVLEITQVAALTIVPGCPAYLRGIMNLRGEILAVMDLSLFFGLGQAAAGDRLLVLGDERPEFGILIGEAEDVRELPRSTITAPAVAIGELHRRFLLGVTPDAILVLAGGVLLNDEHFMIDEA